MRRWAHLVLLSSRGLGVCKQIVQTDDKILPHLIHVVRIFSSCWNMVQNLDSIFFLVFYCFFIQRMGGFTISSFNPILIETISIQTKNALHFEFFMEALYCMSRSSVHRWYRFMRRFVINT